jgi:hypothetical protein
MDEIEGFTKKLPPAIALRAKATLINGGSGKTNTKKAGGKRARGDNISLQTLYDMVDPCVKTGMQFTTFRDNAGCSRLVQLLASHEVMALWSEQCIAAKVSTRFGNLRKELWPSKDKPAEPSAAEVIKALDEHLPLQNADATSNPLTTSQDMASTATPSNGSQPEGSRSSTVVASSQVAGGGASASTSKAPDSEKPMQVTGGEVLGDKENDNVMEQMQALLAGMSAAQRANLLKTAVQQCTGQPEQAATKRARPSRVKPSIQPPAALLTEQNT